MTSVRAPTDPTDAAEPRAHWRKAGVNRPSSGPLNKKIERRASSRFRCALVLRVPAVQDVWMSMGYGSY